MPNQYTKAKNIDVPVEFAGISIGKETASITLKILKSKLSGANAEHFLCNARLDVAMKVDAEAGDDVPGQETIAFDDADGDAFEGIGDVKSYRSGSEFFSCSLVLHRNDTNKLILFAQERGRLVATRTGAASDKREDDSEGGE